MTGTKKVQISGKTGIVPPGKKMNSLASKYFKQWLGLSCSITVAVLHHSSVLNIPMVDSYFIKAKLSYLASITLSTASLWVKTSNSFCTAHRITDEAKQQQQLSIVKESVMSIKRKTLPKASIRTLENCVSGRGSWMTFHQVSYLLFCGLLQHFTYIPSHNLIC